MLALFVRFQDSARQQARAAGLVASVADIRVVRRQHRIFYALLLVAPLEWWWRQRPAGWAQLAGAATFLAGVVGYRAAGAVLGPQLSPLVAPREPARLVMRGPYGLIRHPMYLAELAMAVGVPWMLGARLSMLLTLLFAAMLLRRIGIEERALRDRLPDYAGYAAHTYRLIPYVY